MEKRKKIILIAVTILSIITVIITSIYIIGTNQFLLQNNNKNNTQIKRIEGCKCSNEYEPVCGLNSNKTYYNSCEAACDQQMYKYGKCK